MCFNKLHKPTASSEGDSNACLLAFRDWNFLNYPQELST